MGNATACAQAVVRELVAQGVREVVLAPGSRSAPMAYALWAADRDRTLRLHVRVDERTAGFLALGLARGSAASVAVVTTSGTAVAHLHPAVLEAWHAHVPLLVVSADRPRIMVHTGANQTTHQDHLFAGHVRAQAGLSDAREEPDDWRYEVARLVRAATGVRSRLPGPVHLNVELSEPLAPGSPFSAPVKGPSTGSGNGGPSTGAANGGPSRGAGNWGPAPVRSVTVMPSVAGPAVSLAGGPRTVVVAGELPPGAGRQVAELATAAGVPLLAEPSSNARCGSTAIATYRVLLGSELADRVERVVMFGHPTLSRPVTSLLSRPDVELVVVSAYADWPDPGRSAARVVDGVKLEGPFGPAWLAEWQHRDAKVSRDLAELLDRQPILTGPTVARMVWSSLGPDDILFAGASNPVRDLDLAPAAGPTPAVYANRGLSGIDGSISTAAGLALATSQPVTALLGDLTTIHDLTGLVIGPDEPRPDLRIVIANDDGGSIFVTLEHGRPEHAEAYERIFGTPHGVDFASVARAVGAGYRRAHNVSDLRAALLEPLHGLELVEAVVDRRGRRALSAAIGALT